MLISRRSGQRVIGMYELLLLFFIVDIATCVGAVVCVCVDIDIIVVVSVFIIRVCYCFYY